MKIKLILVGKTEEDFLKKGISIYVKRLTHYMNLEIKVIKKLKGKKNLSIEEVKKKESELILKQLKKKDNLILLDEKGENFSSLEFAKFLEKKFLYSQNIVFLIGGAYGFSSEIYKKANFKISLSRMTFSHQMISLIFLEQIYRAMTILKGESYHH